METRLIKIAVPGTAFFCEYGVPDNTEDIAVIPMLLDGADKNRMIRIKNPWVLTDKQTLVCPACEGEINEAALQVAPVCPRCNALIIDPNTGQPLELGGRKLGVKTVRIAVSLMHIAEAAETMFVSLNDATLMLINKESNVGKMIEQAKVALEQEKVAEAQARSGLVVANDMGTVNKMAHMAKQAEEQLKKGKFTPKLV